jgi:hypothetical protein
MHFVRRSSLAGLALALAASAFFAGAARDESRLLDAFIERSLAGVDRSDTTAVVLALAHAIWNETNNGVRPEALPLYDRLESTSPFNMTTAVALRHGAFGVIGHEPYGPCGTMTRIFLNACWRLGIPARKVHLYPARPDGPGIHTLAEWRSGARWQAISPSDDFAWRTGDGRVATVEEIRADTAVYAQVMRRNPYFPYRFDDPRHLRLEKLPAVLRGPARAALGERGVRDLETPRLYDEPRVLLLDVSLAAALAFAFAALGTRHPRAGTAHSTGPRRAARAPASRFPARHDRSAV